MAHTGPTITNAEWARLCFAHIVAEKRGKLPVMCGLDDLLPFDFIPDALTEAAIRQTVEAGRTIAFVAYGVRRQALTIMLRTSLGKYDYLRIADQDYWADTGDYCGLWSFLRPFIDALPFTSVGRAMIMFSQGRGRGVMHFDHDKPTLQHEFIWLKPTNKKKFLLRYGSKDHYIMPRSCWFDSRHIHQTDEGPELEVSMRVDGVFTPEFRQHVVARCAKVLELDTVPHVLPPDPTYTHRNRTDWERLFRPRHYAHYYGTLAKLLVQHRALPQMMPPENVKPS